jgi:hypothetical protein
MDINWDQIQQILTFLIIFIAPALLSKFKKEDEEEDSENRPGGLKIEDLVGHKPVVLKDIQKEQESKASEVKKTSKKKKAQPIQQPRRLNTFEEKLQKQPVKIDRERLHALNESFKTKSSRKKSSLLLGISPKKAMLLKDILGPPRGVDPY